VDVFILFPAGRVSPIQRRQMTAAGASNVHAIAVRARSTTARRSSKHCSARRIFASAAPWPHQLDQLRAHPGAGRLLLYRAVALGAPVRAVSFTVPTGNFGDIFAGYAAKRMGLAVERLVIASNVNDILTRTMASGEYRSAT